MVGLVWVRGTKGIYPTFAQHLRQHVAFDWQEAAGFVIAFWTRQVDLMVRRVEITQNIHSAATAKLIEPIKNRSIKIELIANSRVVAILTVALGEVDAGNG